MKLSRNRRLYARIFLICLCSHVFFSEVVFAVESSEAHRSIHIPTLSSLFWPTVNFVMYVMVGIYLYLKYAAPLLRVRSIEVSQELQKSASELNEAVEGLTEVRNRLVNIEQEKSEIFSNYRLEGQKMAEFIVHSATAAADKTMVDVGRHIEHELNQAKKETRRQILLLATKKARAVLEKGLSANDDRRLREQVVRQVEETH